MRKLTEFLFHFFHELTTYRDFDLFSLPYLVYFGDA